MSTTRTELADAIAEVIHQHRLDGFTSRELAFAILDEAEQVIRADEREFLAPEVPMARDDLRNELRAQAAALPSMQYAFEYWVQRDDVLALFDGSSE